MLLLLKDQLLERLSACFRKRWADTPAFHTCSAILIFFLPIVPSWVIRNSFFFSWETLHSAVYRWQTY